MKSQILGISQENPDCEIIEHINNHQFKYFLDRINDIEVMNDFEQKYYTNYLNNCSEYFDLEISNLKRLKTILILFYYNLNLKLFLPIVICKIIKIKTILYTKLII